ncbi:hypothetical protein PG994_000080 [Apiospora phragmitis]|uniref:F-box domain-containing protein n=1 Tax=Apiospora phragmitis TaxID=2905665 RepID=A0ABR1X590_9PEZI
MAPTTLLSLPPELLALLPDHLHTIEDLLSAGSTCRALRHAMDAARPSAVLRLAAAQTRVFFRPSPHYLVMAAARELGHWARRSEANEQRLALGMRDGLDGLLELAVGEARCGLTLARIRELHEMRFSLMNRVTDIIDKCVGEQWYALPDFWDGGVDDAYTISAEPSETLFHLAIYGELFGPDLDALLDPDRHEGHRPLQPATRIEYVKYGVPDFACHLHGEYNPRKTRITAPPDPRRLVYPGPLPGQRLPRAQPQPRAHLDHQQHPVPPPPGRDADRRGGLPSSGRSTTRGGGTKPRTTRTIPSPAGTRATRTIRTYGASACGENVMVCQGLEGLQMLLLPGKDETETETETKAWQRERWVEKVRAWRRHIENLAREPALVKVGRQATLVSPYLLGDLRICVSGYVSGS